MIFKTRPNIKKSFETIHNFGYKNLIVGGCSFTYNNSDNTAVSWPYYLRDLGGFDQVLDCSLPGSGNYHIANSLKWALEIDQPNPSDSLVIVMWSGNNRDDYISPDSNIKTYPYSFKFSKNCQSGISAGNSSELSGNTIDGLKSLGNTKSEESRAIENYLHIRSLWSFLKTHGYNFVFLNYLTQSLKIVADDFEIKPYLPKTIQKNFLSMMTNILDPHTFAIRHDKLWEDEFHPSPDGHLKWTQEILIPELVKIST